MNIWSNFRILHKGINYIPEDDVYLLETSIKDNKTNNTIITIFTNFAYDTLEFHIGTNEHLVKKLNLPRYKHKANPSYMEGNKYFDKSVKKAKNIQCLSIGVGNVKKILNDILDYWKDNGHDVQTVYVTRETGNTRKVKRWYAVH